MIGVIIGMVLILRPQTAWDTNEAFKVNGESPRCPMWILLQRIAGAILIALSLWV